jgi:hypothetical protein
VSHIVIETGGVPFVEGQAFGVVPPGFKVRRECGAARAAGTLECVRRHTC